MNNILILSPSFIRPFILRVRFSLKTVWILSLGLMFFLLIFYIFQVNQVTKASFAISNYEKQMTELSQESKSLEMSFSDLSSLASVETLVSTLNYEKVNKVHYIQMLEGTALAK